jgi:hypothetical protein
LQKSLQQEHARAGQLEKELAAARRDVETQTALVAKASAESSKAKQATDGVTDLQKSLQQERERASRLENYIATSLRDVDARTIPATKAAVVRLKQELDRSTAELKKSLQAERDRAGQLEKDLAAARRDVETQATLAAKASDDASKLKQAAESGAAELRKSLQQERARVAQLERDLASARNTRNAAGPAGVTTGQITSDQAREAAPKTPAAAEPVTVAVARADVRPGAADAAEEARLVARASVLLGQGDIGSARIVLERAAETGNAQASFTLAETYDPLILSRWGAYGTRGDASKARDLYAKAAAGGINEAKERLDALRR